MLVVQETSAKSSVVTLAAPGFHFGESHKISMLEFHRYGDEYFLAKIWTSASDESVSLPESPREKQITHTIHLR